MAFKTIVKGIIVVYILLSEWQVITEAFQISGPTFRPSKALASANMYPWSRSSSLRENSRFYDRINLHKNRNICAHAPSKSRHNSNIVSMSMLQGLESLSNVDYEQVAGGLFAVSLFPYLGFLYHLGRPENKTPALGFFGFCFLLVFVFVSIPAAIAAMTIYGRSLADVDWLHGSAESFLTITNLFIVLGFRRALASAPPAGSNSPNSSTSAPPPPSPPTTSLFSSPAAVAAALALSAAPAALLLGTDIAAGGGAFTLPLHPEPANALSLPTWAVHVSSLIEWLAAMGLVWRYAAVTGNPRWKGLTWGMLPFHASGLCACTYHVFYNPPALQILLAMQAGLTVVGDMTCWLAAYRIYQYSLATQPPAVAAAAGTASATAAVEDAAGSGAEGFGGLVAKAMEELRRGDPRGDVPGGEKEYLVTLTAVVFIASAVVKWGELLVDFPFHPTVGLAVALIFLPTAVNILTWLQRSAAPDGDTGAAFSEFY